DSLARVVARLRLGAAVAEPRDADLGVAADDLDQQPLLGAEVVVEEAAADARLAGDLLERGPGRAALGAAVAHGIDDALSLLAAQLPLFRGRLHRVVQSTSRPGTPGGP